MSVRLWDLLTLTTSPAAAEAVVLTATEPCPRYIRPIASVPLGAVDEWIRARNWTRASRGVLTMRNPADLAHVAAATTNSTVLAAVCRNPHASLETVVRLYRHGNLKVRDAACRREEIRNWIIFATPAEIDVYLSSTDEEELSEFLYGVGSDRAWALALRTWLPITNSLGERISDLAWSCRDDYHWESYGPLRALAVNPHVSTSLASRAVHLLCSCHHCGAASTFGPLPQAARDSIIAFGTPAQRRVLANDPNLTGGDLEALAYQALSDAQRGAPDNALGAVLAHPGLPFDTQRDMWNRRVSDGRTASFLLLENPALDPLFLYWALGEPVPKTYQTEDARALLCEVLPRAMAPRRGLPPLLTTRASLRMADSLARDCLDGTLSSESFAPLGNAIERMFRSPERAIHVPVAVASLLGRASKMRAYEQRDALLCFEADRRLGDSVEAWTMLVQLLPAWEGTIGELIDCVLFV